MRQAETILNDVLNACKQSSEFKDYSRMEIAGRKVEFEKNLDNMWAIYTKGNPKQIVEYNKGVNYIKSLGFKVLRNSVGKHKLILKGE